jgi:DNA-binding winged helix-turn-helix (wHTH) protein
MLPPPTTSRLVRFGTFQVDPKSRELCSRGRRIRLQEQPFLILSLLLDHPGEVVTREELRRALWPRDTFVDFDRGLNKAINKLRKALGDSAKNPRYIETLSRCGYRLLVPVDRAHETLQSSNGLSVPEPQTTTNNRASGMIPNSHAWGRVIAIGHAALRTIFSVFSRKCPAMPLRDLPGRRVEDLRSAETRRY